MRTGLRTRLSRALVASFAMACAAVAFAGTASAAQRITLHNFCAQRGCVEGRIPYGPVLRDNASGDLFGITVSGGLKGSGTVFRLRRNAESGKWRANRIHSSCARLNCADGAGPVGNLVMDVSGALYGVTQYGGRYDGGVVFKLAPVGNAIR